MSDYHQTNDTGANAHGWTPVAGTSPFEGGQNGAPAAGRDSGALDWDSEIRNTGSEFVLLPEGDYPFTVTKFERQHHPGSAKLPPCDKAELTITLDGGPLGMAVVTHNLFLHAKTEWRLYQFFESIGQHAKGSEEALKPRWNEVLGARGRCHAAVQEYHSTKYGDIRRRNEITKFYPSPDAAASGAPAAQDAASAVEQTAIPLPAAPRRYF